MRRHRPQSATAPLHLAVAVAVLVALTGCGHKKPPQPPPQIIPVATQDLKVQQRGAELILSFAYPQTTITGLPLGELEAVQLWELERQVFPVLPEKDEEGDAEDEDEEGDVDGEEVEEAEEAEDEAEEPGGEEAEEPVAESEEDDEPGEPAEDEAEPDGEPGEPAEDEIAPDDEEDEEAARRDRRRRRREADAAAAADGRIPGEFEFEGVRDYDLPTPGPAADEADVDETPLFGPRIFIDELSGELETRMQVDPMEFAATSRVRLTLEGAELESAVVGDRVVARFPVTPPQTTDELEGYVFAVKTISSKGLGSPFSNLARVVIRPTPSPPTEFEVEPGDDGIELTWTTDLEDDEFKGFNVYRRSAQDRAYGVPLRRVMASAESFVDREARYGERYIYGVATILVDLPLIETALSTEREVDYQDRFAPPAPENVVALAEVGSVRVLWDASDAPDVAGYFVERRVGPGDWQTLNEESQRKLEYVDREVVSGATYGYRVWAVDQIGNRGEPSEAAETRVP